jgi:hypothetical protein
MRTPIWAAIAAGLMLAASDQALAQADPALAQEVAAAIPGLRAEIPKQVDEITTLTGVRGDGPRFVYDMRLSVTIASDRLAAVRETAQRLNQTRLCAQAPIVDFVRRGGSMRHIYTDAAGTRFETLVTACP